METSLLSLPSPNAERSFVWAKKLLKSHRFEEALVAYNECLILDPSNEKVLYKRGLTNGLLGNADDSMDDFNSVFLQRFLKEAKLYKQSVLEPATQKPVDGAIAQAIVESDDFFSAMADLQETGKRFKETFDELLQDQESINKNLGLTEKETAKFLEEAATVAENRLSNYQEAEHQKQIEALDSKAVNLSHVQGLKIVKERLYNSIVLPIKRPDLFTKYKKKRSSAVLLYGPPGCGKTMLVKALAGETGSALVTLKFNEVVSCWVGDTEKNVHQLFEEARGFLNHGSKSCILFLDELDSIGVSRDLVRHESSGSHRDTVNQLLTELDGVERNSDRLVIIAASNRPWDIDTALKRSGRIGQSIYIPPPSKDERKQLFKHYIGNCNVENLDIDKLARSTEDCCAADIEAIVEEAKMHPILREHLTGVESSLRMEDFEAVLADPVMGKGTLRDWYASVTNELSNESIDMGRYSPMIDDIKKALARTNSRAAISPSV